MKRYSTAHNLPSPLDDLVPPQFAEHLQLLDLLSRLLCYDPAQRIGAAEALQSPYVSEYYSPADQVHPVPLAIVVNACCQHNRAALNLECLDLELPVETWKEMIDQELVLQHQVLN